MGDDCCGASEQPSNDEATMRLLDDALRLALTTGDEFRARCREAALQAVEIHTLRGVVPEVGVERRSVADYLRCLADAARTSVDALACVARLARETPTEPAFAMAWGRIAQPLGLDLRQAVLHLRLTFAEAKGCAQLPDALLPELVSYSAHQKGTGPDPLAQYEQFLNEDLSRWDECSRDQFFACVEELRKSYRQAAHCSEIQT